MPRPTWGWGWQPIRIPPPSRPPEKPRKEGMEGRAGGDRRARAISRAAEILTRYEYDPELNLYVDYESGETVPREVYEALKELLDVCQG